MSLAFPEHSREKAEKEQVGRAMHADTVCRGEGLSRLGGRKRGSVPVWPHIPWQVPSLSRTWLLVHFLCLLCSTFPLPPPHPVPCFPLAPRSVCIPVWSQERLRPLPFSGPHSWLAMSDQRVVRAPGWGEPCSRTVAAGGLDDLTQSILSCGALIYLINSGPQAGEGKRQDIKSVALTNQS